MSLHMDQDDWEGGFVVVEYHYTTENGFEPEYANILAWFRDENDAYAYSRQKRLDLPAVISRKQLVKYAVEKRYFLT